MSYAANAIELGNDAIINLTVWPMAAASSRPSRPTNVTVLVVTVRSDGATEAWAHCVGVTTADENNRRENAAKHRTSGMN